MTFSSVPKALIGDSEMNILKYAVFTFAIVIGLSPTAFGQESQQRDGEKRIPKPNAPVVIANPDKKNDDKSDEKRREEERRGNKPRII